MLTRRPVESKTEVFLSSFEDVFFLTLTDPSDILAGFKAILDIFSTSVFTSLQQKLQGLNLSSLNEARTIHQLYCIPCFSHPTFIT